MLIKTRKQQGYAKVTVLVILTVLVNNQRRRSDVWPNRRMSHAHVEAKRLEALRILRKQIAQQRQSPGLPFLCMQEKENDAYGFLIKWKYIFQK